MRLPCLVTSVENSVLAKAGTANDVLGKVPGVLKTQDSFEVFGKGSPLIYINGQQVRSQTELDQLSSDEIKHVEVITNPGARYDATVKAVIRIQTVRRKGDGFGVSLRSSYYQSENVDLTEQADVNYRHDGLDLFGTFRYSKNEVWEDTDMHQSLLSEERLDLRNTVNYASEKQSLRGVLGLNYMFNDKHAADIKYTIQGNPRKWTGTDILSIASLDGKEVDRLSNSSHSDTDQEPSHQLNAYYTGSIGCMDIEFNADYYRDSYLQVDLSDERSEEQEDRVVHATTDVKNDVAAAKLVLSWPVWGGKLSVGGEWSYTHRRDDYLNEENYVPTTFSKIEEMNGVAFAEYDKKLPFGELSLGLRYERTRFDYYKNDQRRDDQCRNYDNLYPHLAFHTKIGKVQTQISYSAKTKRPSYRMLSNNVLYVDRYTQQQGNPALRPENIYCLNWNATWKFLLFSIEYQQTDHTIIYWGESAQEDATTILLRTVNADKPLRALNAFVSASPRFGIWSPRLSLGVTRQWWEIEYGDQLLKLNKPLFVGTLSNSLSLPWDLLMGLDVQVSSKGDSKNVRMMRTKSNVDLSLRKSFLNETWSVELRGSDLFHQAKNHTLLRSGAYSIEQHNQYDSREFSITVRYKFNATKSKYKGAGAANEELKRL